MAGEHDQILLMVFVRPILTVSVRSTAHGTTRIREGAYTRYGASVNDAGGASVCITSSTSVPVTQIAHAFITDFISNNVSPRQRDGVNARFVAGAYAAITLLDSARRILIATVSTTNTTSGCEPIKFADIVVSAKARFAHTTESGSA